ncbi:hypothetical protein HK104_001818, partial [Borealophlyctis nickersoniae]
MSLLHSRNIDSLNVDPATLPQRRCYSLVLRIAAARIPAHQIDIETVPALITHSDLAKVRRTGGASAIYACLAAYRTLNREAKDEADDFLSKGKPEGIVRAKADFCMYMAVRIVREQAVKGEEGEEELFVDMLTCRFQSIHEKSRFESALEVAVASEATEFVNEMSVRKCIQYIWKGRILADATTGQVSGKGPAQCMYTLPSQPPRNGFAGIPAAKLRLPMYQYAAETIFNMLLLGVFSYVVNHRTVEPTVIEYVMYVLVFSAAVEEVRQVHGQGLQFYLLTLWNVIDILTLVLFVSAGVFRILGTFEHYDDPYQGAVDKSYDMLSINAIFLWARVVHVLSGFNYFGETVIIVRAMLKDALLFFVLFFFVIAGFTQAFIGLAAGDAQTPMGVLYLLARSVLGDPDFDTAQETHPTFGAPLLLLYMFLGAVMLINMLVAFFNQSYEQVLSRAKEEQVRQFAIR